MPKWLRVTLKVLSVLGVLFAAWYLAGVPA